MPNSDCDGYYTHIEDLAAGTKYRNPSAVVLLPTITACDSSYQNRPWDFETSLEAEIFIGYWTKFLKFAVIEITR